MTITDRDTGAVVDMAIGSTTVTLTAPTAAEVNALTRFEVGAVDGIDTPSDGASVDISGICASRTARIAGKIDDGDISGMCWREPAPGGTDAFWVAFEPVRPAVAQYLVTCRAGFTGALIAGEDGAREAAATDVVDIRVVHVLSRSEVKPSETEGQRFTYKLSKLDLVEDIALV